MGLGADLKSAQNRMETQTAEMQRMDTVNDEMVEQVEELTKAFLQIDDERQRANFVNLNPVKSAPVHVQGAQTFVTEPAGNVQTAPPSDVINLMSQGTSGSERDVAGQGSDGPQYLVGKPWSIKDRMAALTANAASGSSTVPMTSATASTEATVSAGVAANPHAASSSQNAQQTGLFPPPATPHVRDAGIGDANRPNTIRPMPSGESRVIVDNPPQLPSGTQRAIERIVQAHMERMGVNPRPHEEQVREQNVLESTAGNMQNTGPEIAQFSFPRMTGGNVAPTPWQQVFTTAQWRPKEPPSFTGNASDDVYLWTSLVEQYFVFMNGTARQEVAFAATLLRGAAHEWYRGYRQRNDNQPPRDWPTMQQAILERFGSNIREQEAHAKLLTLSQGKRSVRDYTSEFETLLGRLSIRDETTWKRMYIWGLQPHLAEAVALKYPGTIAQAAGHAEEIELAKRASQRPHLGNLGARPAGNYSGRGGSQAAPRTFVQGGRGRGNAGANQQRGRGNGGRRGGGWNRGRQGGNTTTTAQTRTGTHCYNCGQYGHYASQCPRAASTSGSSGTAQSVNQRSNMAQAQGNRAGRGGNRRGGSNRRTRFSGLNVVYDAEGNEYPIDDNGNIVLEFCEEEDPATSQQNYKNSEN